MTKVSVALSRVKCSAPIRCNACSGWKGQQQARLPMLGSLSLGWGGTSAVTVWRCHFALSCGEAPEALCLWLPVCKCSLAGQGQDMCPCTA